MAVRVYRLACRHHFSTAFFLLFFVGGLFVARLAAEDAATKRPTTVFAVALADDDKEGAKAAAAEARNKQKTTNNMKRIMLAMLNYHDTFNKLPAAYSGTAEKPLLSWRVALLPYLEQQALYNDFHRDEPWDSEYNKALVAKMPDVYRAPTSVLKDGRTVYVTPRGDNTSFPGGKNIGLAHITDGTSNTIAVVEVDDAAAVPWTKPDDWKFEPQDPKAELGGHYLGGFHAALCDGSVHFIADTIAEPTLTALFTRNGGEPVRLPD
ncbi:MAG TPA: DUF1559 domain-containing protein [Pirellulales bacterium]|jgi:hypothetical protein